MSVFIIAYQHSALASETLRYMLRSLQTNWAATLSVVLVARDGVVPSWYTGAHVDVVTDHPLKRMRILAAVDAGVEFVRDCPSSDTDVYYADCDYFLMDAADSVPLAVWGTMDDHYTHIAHTHSEHDPYVAEMRDNYEAYCTGLSYEVHRPMPIELDRYAAMPRTGTTSWRSRYGNTVVRDRRAIEVYDGKVTSIRGAVGVLWLSNRDDSSWNSPLMAKMRERFVAPSMWEIGSEI